MVVLAIAFEPVVRQNNMIRSVWWNRAVDLMVAREMGGDDGLGSPYPLQGHSSMTYLLPLGPISKKFHYLLKVP